MFSYFYIVLFYESTKFLIFKLELTTGVEPVTSPLPREYSTTEPREQNVIKNLFILERATRVELATSSLEGWHSTN